MLEYYKKILQESPNSFLNDYLEDPLLQRLKKVGYFCGMDYASKDVYDFSEYISRYDHSLTVALLIYKLTHDKKMSLAGLYHDVATPCFSHVIDYMNKDYYKQESTEKYTSRMLNNDGYLGKLLQKDNINIDEIIDYKDYSIVDNDRPFVCADRLDAVILNSMGWIKNITKDDIYNIINDLTIYENEYYEPEIGFKNKNIAKRFQYLNDEINKKMHSKEDIYMMELLANITKLAIDRKYLQYEDLYVMNEEELINLLGGIYDADIKNYIYLFKNALSSNIPNQDSIIVKNRNIMPLVRGKRLL